MLFCLCLRHSMKKRDLLAIFNYLTLPLNYGIYKFNRDASKALLIVT